MIYCCFQVLLLVVLWSPCGIYMYLKARLIWIRQRQLELIANYMVEVSVPTMILFCMKSAKMLLIYING